MCKLFSRTVHSNCSICSLKQIKPCTGTVQKTFATTRRVNACAAVAEVPLLTSEMLFTHRMLSQTTSVFAHAEPYEFSPLLFEACRKLHSGSLICCWLQHGSLTCSCLRHSSLLVPCCHHSPRSGQSDLPCPLCSYQLRPG